MPRRKRFRRISGEPMSRLFKPAGIPSKELVEIVLSFDELEAIRLADFEGLYQEQAAEKMNISRQTFGRVIAAARKKIAQALIEGKVLRIEGGVIEVEGMRRFACPDCEKEWWIARGVTRPECPDCDNDPIRRTNTPHGKRGNGRKGHGRRRGR